MKQGLTISPYYDKYYVIKCEKFKPLCESVLDDHASISNVQINSNTVSQVVKSMEIVIADMHILQDNRYFCLNLDEKASEEAILLYYTASGAFSMTAAKEILRKLHKPWIGKVVVFKHKTICSGVIVEEWIHMETRRRIFDIKLANGSIIPNIPREWIVKEIKEGGQDEGNQS